MRYRDGRMKGSRLCERSVRFTPILFEQAAADPLENH
jgi:hypothetical protein